MDKSDLAQTLDLGKIAQVGCVVRNLAERIKTYQEIIAIGPFTTVDLRPEQGTFERPILIPVT